MTEADIMRQIQLAATKLGARLFRNNVGMATTNTGSVIRFGLAVGSADLIGWTKSGRFLAIEIKTSKGRLTKHQRQFLDAISASGGIAGVARSVEDAVEIIQGASNHK